MYLVWMEGKVHSRKTNKSLLQRPLAPTVGVLKSRQGLDPGIVRSGLENQVKGVEVGFEDEARIEVGFDLLEVPEETVGFSILTEVVLLELEDEGENHFEPRQNLLVCEDTFSCLDPLGVL